MSILLSTFYFFYFGIVGVYVIFMPKVLDSIGYDASEIGVIFAAGPLVRFLLPFAFTRGFRLDVKRFNLALVVMFVSSIFFYLSINDFYALLLSNVGMGIGMSLILPYVEVMALDSIGKERYGKIRLFGSVGFVLVALVLVRFLSTPEVALSYLLGFTFFTVILAFVIANKTIKNDAQETQKENDVTILKHWKLWLGLILTQVGFGAFYNFFTIYETGHGIALDVTVNLWVFGVLAEIVMLYAQGRLLKLNLVLLLEITTFSAIVRWALIFLFPQNLGVLFFAQSLHALSFALFYSAAISYLHQLYANKVLAQQFFSGLTFGLGGFVGAIGFGYVYEWRSEYTFLIASMVAFASFFYIRSWKKELQGNGRS